MTHVGNINANAASISANSSRANLSLNFNSTVNKQSKWQRGGAPQYNPLADKSVKIDELKNEASNEQEGDVKSSFGVPQTWQQFYKPSSTYFPRIDYYQRQREAMMFESIKGKAGFSPILKQNLSY